MTSGVDGGVDLNAVAISSRETGVRLAVGRASSMTTTTLLGEAGRKGDLSAKGNGSKGGELHFGKIRVTWVRGCADRKQRRKQQQILDLVMLRGRW